MSHDLLSEATFSRASVAYYLDADLVIQQALAEVVRSAAYWDAGKKGTLLEIGSANILPSIDLSSWNETGTSVVTGSQSDPAGGSFAFLLTDDDAGGWEYVDEQLAATSDSIHAVSVFAKEGTSTSFSVDLYDSDATAYRLQMDIAWTAGLPVVTPQTGTYLGYQAVSGGWFRLFFQTTALLGANVNSLFLVPTSTGVAQTGTCYFYWPQVESSCIFPTSPILPGTPRLADALTWPFTLPPQGMTLYLRFVDGGTRLSSSGQVRFAIEDASHNDPYFWLTGANNVYAAEWLNAAATPRSSSVAATPSIGDIVELRVCLYPDGRIQIHYSVNGGSESSGSASASLALPAAWSDTTLWLNTWGGASVLGAEGVGIYQACKIERGIQSRAYMRVM